jgi:hypothetical protein
MARCFTARIRLSFRKARVHHGERGAIAGGYSGADSETLKKMTQSKLVLVPLSLVPEFITGRG